MRLKVYDLRDFFMSLLPKNRILVPIDFSEASFQALDETLAFVDDPAQIY